MLLKRGKILLENLNWYFLPIWVYKLVISNFNLNLWSWISSEDIWFHIFSTEPLLKLLRTDFRKSCHLTIYFSGILIFNKGSTTFMWSFSLATTNFILNELSPTRIIKVSKMNTNFPPNWILYFSLSLFPPRDSTLEEH